ncbi:MAG: hypothetical protein U9Q81_13400 [Pseudomonadota bacterium]|nr:hypothetical protein [Pseudomonadota bacterium]
MNVHLHIDELVLEGLPLEATDAAAVKAAVETELTRLLANGGLAPDLRTGGARASVPAGDIHLGGDRTPSDLGRQIGRTLYRGINR